VQHLLRLNQKLTGKKLKIIQHDLNYHIMNSAPNTESTINHNTTHNTTRKHQRVSSEDGFFFFNICAATSGLIPPSPKNENKGSTNGEEAVEGEKEGIEESGVGGVAVVQRP